MKQMLAKFKHTRVLAVMQFLKSGFSQCPALWGFYLVTDDFPYFYLRVEFMIYQRDPAIKLYYINITYLKSKTSERKTKLLYTHNI